MARKMRSPTRSSPPKFNLTTTGTVKDIGEYIEYYYRDPDDGRKEDAIQKAYAAWFRFTFPDKLAFHPVNERECSPQERDKMDRMGMLTGISDWVILSSGISHPKGLIELKRATKSISTPVSPEQKRILLQHRKEGGFSAVAYGLSSAIFATYDYFGIARIS